MLVLGSEKVSKTVLHLSEHLTHTHMAEQEIAQQN